MMTSLVLKITSAQNELMGTKAIMTFGIEGGTIGRSAGNDWILPDPSRFLSSQHALISYQDNQFFITDLSSNGLFINDESDAIGKGNTTPLSQVNTLSLGEYSVSVTINTEGSHIGDHTFQETLPGSLLSDVLLSPSQPPTDGILLPEDLSHDPMDFLNSAIEKDKLNHFDLPANLFDEDASHLRKSKQTLDEFSVTPKIDDAFIPPTTTQDHSQATGIPENWDDTSFTPIPSPLIQTPPLAQSPIIDRDVKAPHQNASPPVETSSVDFIKQRDASLINTPSPENSVADKTLITPTIPEPSELLALFEKSQPTTSAHQIQPTQANKQEKPNTAQDDIHKLPDQAVYEENKFNIARAAFKAKGLDPELLNDPKFIDQAAALLPYFLDGTLDILRSRASIKNELRASKTILQSIENNPLKFSINLQDAIQNVITNQRPGFLNPTDAVQQAFEDLAQHESALIAGIQAGLNALLEKMSPDTIETKIESLESKRNLFGKISPSKKWTFYKETYQQILDNSSDSFIDMFGSDFVKAYESHINNLKYNGK